MKVGIPDVAIQHAGLASIAVGQVGIGPIAIGELVLDNTDVAMSAAVATLTNMQVTITLGITLGWHIHIPLPWPFDDIDVGDTYDVGNTPRFAMTVGDVAIPGLNNIEVHIPSVWASNLTATLSPLTGLKLGSAIAEEIRAHNLAVPAQDLTLTGLSVDAVHGSAITVPAASVGDVTIRRVQGDPVTLGALTLGGLSMPAASIPDITSQAPLDIPVVLAARTFRMDAGILVLTLTIRPSARSHIDQLRITNANASATIGQIVVHDVVFPYELLNLTLSQVGIETIEIPAFAIS